MKEKSEDQSQEDQTITQSKRSSQADLSPTSITFGDTPVTMKCPFCLQHIRSEIINKPEFVSFSVGLLLFAIVPQMIMLILVLVLMQLTATKKHRCSLCQRQLGGDGKFLIYFTDEVYSFSFFSSGIIITKKILITCVIIFLAFLVISLRFTILQKSMWLETSWSEFRQDFKDLDRQKMRKYEGKAFKNWNGWIMRVADHRAAGIKYSDHAIYIYLKMEPTFTPITQPDLILTLSSDVVHDHLELVSNLKHGEEILFNSTYHMSRKNNAEDKHLHGFDIKKTGKFDDQILLYITNTEEEWIEAHVEDKNKLTTHE